MLEEQEKILSGIPTYQSTLEDYLKQILDLIQNKDQHGKQASAPVIPVAIVNEVAKDSMIKLAPPQEEEKKSE